MLCHAKLDVNSDIVSIQKEIDWFAMNCLNTHEFDINVYLNFVSEHIFWQEGVKEFEDWILEMLYY